MYMHGTHASGDPSRRVQQAAGPSALRRGGWESVANFGTASAILAAAIPSWVAPVQPKNLERSGTWLVDAS